jgi:H+/Cl- antiporter ClcA
VPTLTSLTGTPKPEDKRVWLSIVRGGFGGFLGGVAGGSVVVIVTLALKACLDFVSGQRTWLLLVLPLIGLALTVTILQGWGQRQATPDDRATDGSARPHRRRRRYTRRAIQADITGDVVDTAGEEEHFPWRLTPLRTLAIFATVGLGQAMGTEAPAAYFGVAAGAFLGDRGRRWRQLLRPAAVGGGAAGVAALMAIPLVGTAYLLEIGRRHRAPLSAERVTAALVGGFVGWGINAFFGFKLIRLVVPKEPPDNFLHAAETALLIGVISGAITSLTGAAVYRAKKWKAPPFVRLGLGGLAAAVTAVLLVVVAAPSVAVGPGTGAILWAERTNALPLTLLAVSLLRASATTAAVAAGGCGGLFVPFLCVGDLSARVLAPGLGVGNDLAGAAGAAGGIAGGYHLPFTAFAMVLGVGGPHLATLTCLATAAVAYFAGEAVDLLLHWAPQRISGQRDQHA